MRVQKTSCITNYKKNLNKNTLNGKHWQIRKIQQVPTSCDTLNHYDISFYGKPHYTNNKYGFYSVRNNLLDPVQYCHCENLNIYGCINNYNKGKTNADKELEHLSKSLIGNLLHGYSSVAKSKNDVVDSLYQLLSEHSVDSSNLDMLMQLIRDKKLSPAILFSCYPGYQMSENCAKDLDKLYESYIQGIPPKDVFVPVFNSEVQACDTLQTGDVCRLNDGEKIYIKMQDSSLKELFISADTFLELFPPVERYDLAQGNDDDCFLVSAFDSIYSNSHSRYRLLELFKENDDGTVNMSFSGYEKQGNNVVLKDSDAFELKDISSQIKSNMKYLSFQSEGLRAFELLYQKHLEYKADKRMQERYDKFIKALENGNDQNTFLIGDFVYTKEELKYFIDLYQRHKKDPENCVLVSVLEKIPIIQMQQSDEPVQEKYLYCDEYESAYINMIKNRYNEFFERTGCQNIKFDEILPVNVYKAIVENKKDMNNHNCYLKGGYPFYLYSLLNLGISGKSFQGKNIEEILSVPDFSNKYVMTCSSVGNSDKDEDFNIKSNHGYSVEVKGNGDERIFYVKNPHNSAYSLPMTKEMFLKYFQLFYIAEI